MRGHLKINSTTTRDTLEEYDFKNFKTNGVLNTYSFKLDDESIVNSTEELLLTSLKIEANMDRGFVSITKTYRSLSSDEPYIISYYYRDAEVFCDLVE